jgi:hypothetical protein
VGGDTSQMTVEVVQGDTSETHYFEAPMIDQKPEEK